jgi:hypothetical protein
MPASIRTPEKEIAFLAALSATANVARACDAAGIGRTTAYEWREAVACATMRLTPLCLLGRSGIRALFRTCTEAASS